MNIYMNSNISRLIFIKCKSSQNLLFRDTLRSKSILVLKLMAAVKGRKSKLLMGKKGNTGDLLNTMKVPCFGIRVHFRYIYLKWYLYRLYTLTCFIVCVIKIIT